MKIGTYKWPLKRLTQAVLASRHRINTLSMVPPYNGNIAMLCDSREFDRLKTNSVDLQWLSTLEKTRCAHICNDYILFFDAAAISLCWFLKWALFDGTGPYNTLISLALTLAVRRCMRMKKDQQTQEAPSFGTCVREATSHVISGVQNIACRRFSIN